MRTSESERPSAATIRTLLSRRGLSDLVTMTDVGLLTSAMPFAYLATHGEYGTLIGHLPRQSPQVMHRCQGDALVIVRSPGRYVTPSAPAPSGDRATTAPGWEHVAVHGYGTLSTVTHREELLGLLEGVTDRYEEHAIVPWQLSEMRPDARNRLLDQMVGVTITLHRVVGVAVPAPDAAPAREITLPAPRPAAYLHPVGAR